MTKLDRAARALVVLAAQDEGMTAGDAARLRRILVDGHGDLSLASIARTYDDRLIVLDTRSDAGVAEVERLLDDVSTCQPLDAVVADATRVLRLVLNATDRVATTH